MAEESAKKDIERQFRKEMGFWSVVFLATGAILGPAVAFTPVDVLADGGPLGTLSWIVALIMVIPVALVYVELGTTWPKAGGVGYYPYKSNGPLAGVISAWGSYIGYGIASASIVIALVEYLSYFFPSLYTGTTLTPLGIVVTGIGIAVLFLINTLRIKHMAFINNAMTVLTILLAFVVIIALGIYFKPSNFNDPSYGGFAPFGVSGLFIAVAATIYAYAGFRQPVDFSEEVKDPGKTIPRAIIITLLLVFAIYFLESIVFVGSLDWKALGLNVGNWSGLLSLPYPYVSASNGLGLYIIGIIALLLAILASFKDGLIYFGGASRVAYAMAKYDNALPDFLTKMSEKGIPIASTILTLILSLIFLALFPSFSSIFTLAADGFLISYAPGSISLAVLRAAEKDVNRPYKLPIASISAPFAFVVSSLMIYWSTWSAISIFIPAVLIGVVFLAIYHKKKGLKSKEVLYGIWFPLYLVSLMVLSYIGSSNFGGINLIPFPYDTLVAALGSLTFFYIGTWSGVKLIKELGKYS